MDNFDQLLNTLAIIMRKESEDVFVIYCFGKPYIRLINCKRINFDFIKEIFQAEREYYFETFERREEDLEIDMEEQMREWIRDGAWDYGELKGNKEVEIGSFITGFEDVIKVK